MQPFKQHLVKSMPEIEMNIPHALKKMGVTGKQFCSYLWSWLRQEKQAMEFANKFPESWYIEFLMGVQLGLVIGSGPATEAYITYDKRSGKPKFMTGWKGVKKIAILAGVQDLTPITIYENDECEVIQGTDPKIIHKVNLKESRGNLVAVAVVATLSNGEKHFHIKTESELEKWRKDFAPRSQVWIRFPLEMRKKTVLIQLCKELPTGIGLTKWGAVFQEVVGREEYEAVGVDTNPETIKIAMDARNSDEKVREG